MQQKAVLSSQSVNKIDISAVYGFESLAQSSTYIVDLENWILYFLVKSMRFARSVSIRIGAETTSITSIVARVLFCTIVTETQETMHK